jgi:signal peptidase I
MPENKQKSSNFSILDLFWTLFWLLMLGLVLLKFLVFQHVTVVGKSMMPNYEDSQILVVNQINKNFKRGQVVAVYADRDVAREANYFTRFSARFFLKRIIGLPGESIEIIGGNVIIYNQDNPSGAVLVEDYIPDSTIKSEEDRKFYMPKTMIPLDSYFVMGDNRSNSEDSRSPKLGNVKDYAMFGQETLRIWPISKVEVFTPPKYSFKPVTLELEIKREEFLQENMSENNISFNL